LKPYKELAGQTLIYGLGTIVPRVLNFLLIPLYTYTLVASDLGIFIYLYSYVAFFMVLLTFGMETTYFRFCSLNNSSSNVFNNAFGTLLITSAVFLILVFIFRSSIANAIGYHEYYILLVYLAFIVFFDVLTAIPLAKLRQDNRAKFFAIIRTSNVFINIALNIFFFVVCKDSKIEFLNALYSEEIGVGYAFISNLVASIFTFIVLLPSILKFKLSFDKTLVAAMFKYAYPLVIVGFAGMVNEVADKIFLNYLTPVELNPLKQIGIYGANYKLAVLMTIFIQMFKYAAEPFFFKQALNIDAKEIYSKVMTYFVIFCLLIFLVVTLYIDIFQFAIGKDYRRGLGIVPVILMANLFLGVYYNLSVWYKINNLTLFGALISIIGVLITIVLNVILIPVIGYWGSAIATFVCYGTMVIVSYFVGRRYYPVEYELKRIGFYFFIATAIYFIYNLINGESFVVNILLASLFMFLFLGIVYKIEKMSLNSIKNFIRKN
jgi:O-antigen/teichoic acid export membrane protein